MQGTFYDLISRTLGFIGVIIALFSIPYLFAFPLEISVAQSYNKVNLTLKIQDTKNLEPKNTNLNLDAKAPIQNKDNKESLQKNKEIVNDPKPLPNKTLKPVKNSAENSSENTSYKSIATNKTTVLKNTTTAKAQANTTPQNTAQKLPPKKVASKTSSTQDRSSSKNNPPKRAQAQKATPTIKTQANPTHPTAKTLAQDTNPQPLPNAAQENFQQLKNTLISKIKDQTTYPKAARRRGLEGEVLIEFNIEDGKVINFKILKTSGRAILDKAASQTAKRLLGQKLAEHGTFKINVPLVYRLVNN